jgi:DnaJ domain
MSLHTHYDNLKVTRRAPIEVIRAAYKAMAQKYHPDLNGGNAEALRVMTVLNQSYDVLSNPLKRAEHDAWIAQQEAPPVQHAQAKQPQPPSPPPPKPSPSPAPNSVRPSANVPSPIVKLFRHILNYWVIYLGLAIWVWYANTDHTSSSRASASAPTTAYRALAPQPPAYVKPTGSPLGYPWPQSAGYVYGYPMLAQPGLSTVTIDNSSNSNEAFVKLMSLSTGTPMAMRHFFIPAHGQFTLSNVRAGSYDIRYKDLDSGQMTRSEAFTLIEVPTEDGTSYSNLRMTLYKVRNGNMQSYGISAADFGE